MARKVFVNDPIEPFELSPPLQTKEGDCLEAHAAMID